MHSCLLTKFNIKVVKILQRGTSELLTLQDPIEVTIL